MINAKIILASAALFAAPASAKVMEPIDAINGLINMSMASKFCGLPIPQEEMVQYMMIVEPLLKKPLHEFAKSVSAAADDLGAQYARNGSLPRFCAEVGALYGRYGK